MESVEKEDEDGADGGDVGDALGEGLEEAEGAFETS